MYIFYVDEAGCTGVLPTPTAPIQPIFALGGLIIPRERLSHFTPEWLNLKKRFFPGLHPIGMDYLDRISIEIKGAELRKSIRNGGKSELRQVFCFMDNFLGLLENNGARMLARIYVKPIGGPFNGKSVYTSAVQILARDLQSYLAAQDSHGLMILDSRNKLKNTNVAHSVFTQKFKSDGDAYDRLIEMPVFGHSDNHAGIQAADLICSAFLFPMAAHAYCQSLVKSIHVHPSYSKIRVRFGRRLQEMQFRYRDEDGRWHGGITVSDGLGKQFGGLLFQP